MLSGAYLGERLSPASSSAALTAALAGVEQHDFQLRMWRTTPLPLALSLVFYGGISLLHPIQQVDQTILRALEEGFDLSWTVVLPAVILLVLPFFQGQRGPVHPGQLRRGGGAGLCGSRAGRWQRWPGAAWPDMWWSSRS